MSTCSTHLRLRYDFHNSYPFVNFFLTWSVLSYTHLHALHVIKACQVNGNRCKYIMETVAYKYPDRTRSVHSIASSTGRSLDAEKQGVYGPNRRCHQSAQPLNPKKNVVGVPPILVA